MSSSFCYWCSLTELESWANLKFCLFVSDVNQGNEVSPRFTCVTAEIWELLLSLIECEVV